MTKSAVYQTDIHIDFIGVIRRHKNFQNRKGQYIYNRDDYKIADLF